MDKKLFSERLKKARLDCGYKSQYALAKAYNEKYPPKRKDDAGGNEKNFGGILGTIKNYENDSRDGSPKLEIVCNLCELLGCDVGYLVGDYNEHNYETHKIKEYTGLSETAISRIRSANTDLAESVTALSALNDLLSSELFWDMLSDLDAYRYHCRVEATHPELKKQAKAKGDVEAIRRYNADLKNAHSQKAYDLLELQRKFFRMVDQIEEKEALGRGQHSGTPGQER